MLLCIVSAGMLILNLSDTLLATQNLENGDLLFQSGQFDSAAVYYKRAAENYKVDSARAASILVKLGNSYEKQHLYTEALDAYRQSIRFFRQTNPHDPDLQNLYMSVARVCSNLGQFPDSRAYQDSAWMLTVGRYGPVDLQTAKFLNLAGYEATLSGDYHIALEHYLKALPIYKKLYPDGHSAISGIYVNLGILYDKMLDMEHALEYYRLANEMDIRLQGEDYWLLAYNYLNTGISCMNLDQDGLAGYYFSRSLEIAAHNQLPEVHATAHYYLGRIKQKQRQLSESADYYKQAISIVKNTLGEAHASLANFYGSLGEVMQQMGQYAEAEFYLCNAVENNLGALGKQHPKLADTYVRLAKLYIEINQPDNAHQAITDGIDAVYQTGNAWNPDTPVRYEGCLSIPTLLKLITTRAWILETTYSHTSNKTTLLKALNTYEQAENVIDHMRRGFIRDGSKTALQKSASVVIESAIRTCLQLYEITNSVSYLARAFQFSEKNKSVILGEALYAASLDKIRGVPEEIYLLEKTLINSLQSLQIRLQRDPGDAILQEKFTEFQYQYDSMVFNLAKNFPEYFDLKYNQEVIALDQLQHNLNANQMMLSYFEGDSTWYIFSISRKNIQLRKLSKDSLTTRHLYDFRTAVSTSGSAYPVKTAFHLYRNLVEKSMPRDTKINQLIIVPDGMLGHLPFEALCNTDSSISKEHFLVWNYTISQTHSATIFCHPRREAPKDQLSYAGFAPDYQGPDPDYAARGHFANLPFAREEVEKGNEIFSGRLFVGKEASETNFKKLRPSPAILHLAMHALADDQQPANSKLVFAHDQNTPDDGDLSASEVYALEIPSYLAILSACNTGFGKIHKGEGIMNISRAFIHAGCANVVMSLWQAKDFPTTRIVVDFLRQLKNGQAINDALRSAKLNYLEQSDPLQMHPSNWATLVLVGDSQAISTTYPLKSTLFIGFSMLLLTWGIFRFRRKSTG
jgi:CHAT domain-containing protein/tetratricopeptide (TPR) repeat protein